MAEIKLNKTELKAQKASLAQLTKYLPTLQLKKQQLQGEVNNVRIFMEELDDKIEALLNDIRSWSLLLSEKLTFDITELVSVESVKQHDENIAGVEVPFFDGVAFYSFDYSRFTMPLWVDRAVRELKKLIELREQKKVTASRRALLEEELRQTNIKVNLFEKRLIPECRSNIKKIKIFLGDQEIAAICNAKIAKDKLKRKEELAREAV